jgi:hypothetical protein
VSVGEGGGEAAGKGVYVGEGGVGVVVVSGDGTEDATSIAVGAGVMVAASLGGGEGAGSVGWARGASGSKAVSTAGGARSVGAAAVDNRVVGRTTGAPVFVGTTTGGVFSLQPASPRIISRLMSNIGCKLVCMCFSYLKVWIDHSVPFRGKLYEMLPNFKERV